jgi:hypothetical protein
MPRIFDSEQFVKMEIHEMKEGVAIPGETVTVWLKVMTADQKADCLGRYKQIVSGMEVVDRARVLMMSVRASVKKVENLFYDEAKTKPFEVELKDGMLTQKCLDDLLNAGITGELTAMGEELIGGGIGKTLSVNGVKLRNVDLTFDQKPGEASPNP